MIASIRDTILGQIVRDTEALVASRKRDIKRSDLESMEGFERVPLSLADALRAKGLSIIAEAKKASPSKGVIRESFDPIKIAMAYQKAGAAAISMLTEPLHFQGSIDFLQLVRPELQIPLLRKDFIIDPFQLLEARAYGADAVLLIASCLERPHLAELQEAARELELSVLLELYDPRELDRVDMDSTEIIGVNSRDLRTFEVDLDGALSVLGSLPSSIVRVAESGLRDVDDFVKVRDAEIDAALVGEAFMIEDDPGAALERLKEELA
ncbi:MAG: indole-3-glycerol phosphate synthase TrpC [Bacteroidetes bacterium]|nr:indole-3-glycerol phosphate synthase TrpC [Bacteroidota bacterium]MDA1333636.1 indole-3-glycerol phosphate synthase TrpC [Bacteroidota bacterium]